MQTDAYRLWSIRIVTFALSALAAASAGFWAMRIWEAAPAPAIASTLSGEDSASIGPRAVARALGGGVAAALVPAGVQSAPSANRYALVGVLAAGLRKGAALISIDGQEAKPVRVGSAVDASMLLLSVSGRRAILTSSTDATDKITLDLPPLPN